MTHNSATNDPDSNGGTGPSSAPLLAPSSEADGAPPPKPRRRRKKRPRANKDQIDVVKVLLASVKLLKGASSKMISAYEATIRAQAARAIDGKDSAAIKALIDLATHYDLVVPPSPPPRHSGVLTIPKSLSEADQKECFSIETPISRIVEIILRHYDQQPR